MKTALHEVNGHTRLVGILGWPVGHTLSPAMHNAEFARLGLNWFYVPLAVEPNHLNMAIRGLAAAGFEGFNVTIPHKQAVLSLMDDLTAQARQIGAVNTVRVKDGKLLGMNTDADGWAQDCQELVSLKGARIAIAGAGGAARAVAVAAAHAGVASISIINRTFVSAQDLANHLRDHFPKLELAAASREENGNGRDLVAAAQLVVNTTPIGMGTPEDSLAVPQSWLRRDLAVYDTVYTPAMTATLQKAKSLGAPYRGGVGMLAAQGALAFEAWTGIKPDVHMMEQTLRQHLGLAD